MIICKLIVQHDCIQNKRDFNKMNFLLLLYNRSIKIKVYLFKQHLADWRDVLNGGHNYESNVH